MSLKDYTKEKEENEKIKFLLNLIKPKKKRTEEVKKPGNVMEAASQKPTVKIETREGRVYSIWRKPVIYLPLFEKTKKEEPDFVILNEDTEELYNLGSLEKQFKAIRILNERTSKELSRKLINKMKKPKLLLYMKKNLTLKQLKEAIITAAYLKPENSLIVTEENLKPEVKMAVPETIKLVENASMNKRKIREKINELLLKN